jgi:hypothetical protein
MKYAEVFIPVRVITQTIAEFSVLACFLEFSFNLRRAQDVEKKPSRMVWN